MTDNIRQADKTIRFSDRQDAHNTGNHRSEHSGKGSSLNAKCRKAQVSVNQKIIKNNIDGIGSHVGAHSDPGISGASLCRIDTHLNTVKDHTAHDDSEISHRTVVSFRIGSA